MLKMLKRIVSPGKKLESELRSSQERLKFALQSGRMGTWDINLIDDSILCSDEMLELWGINPGKFKGSRAELQAKVHPEDTLSMRQMIDHAIKNHDIYEYEYRIKPTPDTEKWVLCRGRCTYCPGSNVPTRFSGIVYDITEKKHKEQALLSAIKVRDQFLMIASHELKTPLTCLRLLIDVAEWDLHYDPEQSLERFKNKIKKQKHHLARITRIVDDILDESRISRGNLPLNKKLCNLSDSVKEILESFKILAEEKGVAVQAEIEDNISMTCDQFRIEQVVLNLLMNALRYGEKRPVSLSLKTENSMIVLSVKDSGLGIPPEDQERIFQKFERANAEKETNGMGLGLYIAKHIVQSHEGEIKVLSTPGKGSVFSVILPLTTAPD